LTNPINLRPQTDVAANAVEAETSREGGPVALRRRRAAALPAVTEPAAEGESPVVLRRRRAAALLRIAGTDGTSQTDTPVMGRRLRAAALAAAANANAKVPEPSTPVDDEPPAAGERGGALVSAERRSEDAEEEGSAADWKAEVVPVAREPVPSRGASVRSIFNWLMPPGDEVAAREPAMPLTRRLGVREFWRSNIKIFNRLFLAVPIVVAAGYLYLVAPDGYQVDAVLAIRNPTNTIAMAGGNMQATAGAAVSSVGQGIMERAIDESFAVVNFIRSREAFNELEKTMKVSERFMHSNVDWFHRLSPEADYEARYKNYLSHISVSYSDIEGQITLTTDAYDPETAFEMAKELARISERLVNQFNDRARTDLIKLAQVQMAESESALKNAMVALTDLQIKSGTLDPMAEAQSFATIIGTLREQVAVKRAELGALTSNSTPDSPRAVEIRNMLASLETQIRSEQNRITGRTDALAPLISKFKLLDIDVQLAQQKYNSAAAMLQSSLLESEHQKLYVVNVVSPTPPLVSTIPHRFFLLMSVAAITFLAWLIMRLMLAAVRDHAV